MKKENPSPGIGVILPDDFDIATQLGTHTRGFRPTLKVQAVPMPAAAAGPSLDDWVRSSLANAGLSISGEVDVLPGAAAAGSPKRALPENNKVSFQVDLKEDEKAVVLFEQNGMYVWQHVPKQQTTGNAEDRALRGGVGQQTAVFEISFSDAAISPESAQQRGVIADALKEFVFDKVKAFVLKFVVGKTVEIVGRRLENNVKPGIISITSEDPASWQLVAGVDQLHLPKNRAPKILFLLHGTFSSTVAAFGDLGATPWGTSFLRASLQYYDAVIGFDHVTLGKDPRYNAQQLLDAFTAADWPHAPVFDIVTHSRGALVVRSFIELLLPGQPWQPVFNRVVFVGSTNEGTLLAEPHNWEHLIDLYTNLTAGTCRALSVIAPHTAVPAMIFSGIVGNIGSFVKYLAEAAVTELPGLQAMQPGGEFISLINQTQQGQPTISNSYYCVITSEFKAVLSGDHEPKELPKRFLQLLAGGFIGQLMRTANDLVVNTSSMDGIDRTAGNFIKERFDFGPNPQVYHTNYFTRPEVANAIVRWLGLPAAAPGIVTPIGQTPPGGQTRSSPIPAVPSIGLYKGTIPSKAIHPQIDTDIITVPADQPGYMLERLLKNSSPSFVVVQRQHGSRLLHYAFRGEEAWRKLQGKSDRSILDAFDLHETDASDSQQFSEDMQPVINEAPASSGAGAVTTFRQVVIGDQGPMGVIPENTGAPDVIALAKAARVVNAPQGPEDLMFTRRTMPSFAGEGDPFEERRKRTSGSPVMSPPTMSPPKPPAMSPPPPSPAQAGAGDRSLPTPPPPAEEKKVLCHFYAEMDEEVLVGHTTTMLVTVSREALQRAVHNAAQQGGHDVLENKKLLIKIIARPGFIIVGDNDGRLEIDVPQPGLPAERLFDCQATQEGAGEIWVMVSQGGVVFLKLVLRPRAVTSRSKVPARISDEADANPPKALPTPLNQLRIEEFISAEGIYYKIDIYSEGLKLNGRYKSNPIPIQGGDRVKYVAGLYERIERRWLSTNKDVEKFADELRAEGADLFDELIPKELKKILWDHRHAFNSIQVISSEPFIPWELVHLREPDTTGMPEETLFLGQMGLTRWLEGAGRNGWPPEQLKVRNDAIRYVIPHYPHPDYQLPEALTEEAFLIAGLGAKPILPDAGEVKQALSRPGNFDILHFACHGRAAINDIADANLLMEGRVENGNYILDSLGATTVSKFSRLAQQDQGPLIILNACQAGLQGYKLTGIGGFANAFLMAGAGAFVGALWSIGDHPAFTFTETFYKALKQGKNLSEATRMGRDAARAAGDATWLAYVVYGHPHLAVKFEKN